MNQHKNNYTTKTRIYGSPIPSQRDEARNLVSSGEFALKSHLCSDEEENFPHVTEEPTEETQREEDSKLEMEEREKRKHSQLPHNLQEEEQQRNS